LIIILPFFLFYRLRLRQLRSLPLACGTVREGTVGFEHACVFVLAEILSEHP